MLCCWGRTLHKLDIQPCLHYRLQIGVPDAPVQLNGLLEAKGCCYAQQNHKGLQLTRAVRCTFAASHDVQGTLICCITII